MIKVVTISGLDGSGKSTQIDKLREYLKKSGNKVYYFHAIQFSLPQVITRWLKGSKISSHTKPEKAVTSAGILGIFLRKLVLPIDIFRYKRLLKKLEQNGYSWVVSDRYFYDNVVNIAFLEASSQLMSVAIPRPSLAFFLDADPKDIMRRKRAPEQGITYLEKKQVLYKKAAQKYNLITISGSRPISVVFNNIKKYL